MVFLELSNIPRLIQRGNSTLSGELRIGDVFTHR
jgi:hypothetical protein